MIVGYIPNTNYDFGGNQHGPKSDLTKLLIPLTYLLPKVRAAEEDYFLAVTSIVLRKISSINLALQFHSLTALRGELGADSATTVYPNTLCPLDSRFAVLPGSYSPTLLQQCQCLYLLS